MKELDYDHFKRFLLQELPAEEHRALEERLENEEAFSRELTAHALLYESIQAAGDKELDRQLTQLGKKLLLEENEQLRQNVELLSVQKGPRLPRYLIGIAATLLLLAVLIPVILLNGPAATLPPGQLFAENFSLPTLSEARSTDDQTGVIAPWREAYMAGDYQKAVAELKKLLAREDYSYKSEAHLYLGLSHLALNEPEPALAAFDQVSPGSFYIDEASWYRALTYLKLEETEKARILLTEIAGKATHPKKEKAEEILVKL